MKILMVLNILLVKDPDLEIALAKEILTCLLTK
jgi:hypothetical protein